MSTIVAQSHFIFGLRTGVSNNLCFFDEHTVVFPSGNSCVCFNVAQRCQRIIPGSEKSRGMRALAISPNRRYLAVSECGETATVTVFDLQHEQGRKRKVLTAGDAVASDFICVAFSPDSKYLVGQTGGPEWMLILWLWEKQKVLATVRTSSDPNNSVTQVSFSPYSNTQLCVSGRGVFKLLRYSEGSLKQSGAPKVESVDILCHTWASGERAIAGTDNGRLLVFESGDLRGEINVASTAVQLHSDRQMQIKKIRGSDVEEGPRITAILSYSKGFACSLGPGAVCLFEKTEEDGYRRSREMRIPPDPCSNELTSAECQEIDTMCISPAEETLAISTDRGQLYSFSLSSVQSHTVVGIL
ncbi:cilia- and flagella-associated protein 57 [Pseudoliparis swirei]|uniref:cilia- and flagella-associated protein 57 n=1 Tax=Pseudoliparis swirei TaxID=2059687 RepID=UPI0024BEA195|nr:cilia- and flagella-associated protein 57 [Pseudoliparis swirei]